MPRDGNGFQRVLKRELSRIVAWVALLGVLILYPLLLLVFYGIAVIHYRRAR